MNSKAFRITDGKGFGITFANGWAISVQFGPGNYCENYDDDYRRKEESGRRGSDDAEIAIIDPNGGFFKHPEYTSSDSVCGRLSADDVSEFIAWTASQA